MSGTTVAADVQPSVSVCEMPYAEAASPAVTSTAPGRSSRRPSPARLSVSHHRAPRRRTAPTGTLTSRVQRHDHASTSTPPTNPPAAPPPAPTAVQVAMARARAAPSGTADVTIVSVEGASTAAPSPCTARATNNCQPSWARPPPSEASVNRPSPTRNIRLRPYRSPARPPSSMNPAKAIAYAFTTHWRPCSLRARSARTDGSATLTTDMSSTTRNCPAHARATTSQTGGVVRGRGARVTAAASGMAVMVSTAGCPRHRDFGPARLRRRT
jgi:hypothetical protein